MMKKRLSYPRTTASQRQHLFEVWQSTGDVQRAVSESRVSLRSFYYWKPRFEQGGYEALESFASQAPKNPRHIGENIEARVIHLRQQHPKWGKRRISDELAKENNWTALVSPNTVRRILMDAGLWPLAKTTSKKRAI